MKVTLQNLSARLVEMGLLPKDAGDITLSSMPMNLSAAIRRLAMGHLMIVCLVTPRLLKVTTIEKSKKIKTTYVLACNNQ